MNFDVSTNTILIGFITMLLLITAYFLKQTGAKISELDKDTRNLSGRMARLEGKCEVNHK